MFKSVNAGELRVIQVSDRWFDAGEVRVIQVSERWFDTGEVRVIQVSERWFDAGEVRVIQVSERWFDRWAGVPLMQAALPTRSVDGGNLLNVDHERVQQFDFRFRDKTHLFIYYYFDPCYFISKRN